MSGREVVQPAEFPIPMPLIEFRSLKGERVEIGAPAKFLLCNRFRAPARPPGANSGNSRTALFAGGPIQGGRVVGTSDEIGYAPKDRPVSTAEIAATVFQGLGIDPGLELPGPQSRPLRLVDHGVEPIHEPF